MKVALVAAIGSLYDQAVNHYQIGLADSACVVAARQCW